jgi:hypothetical protein
MPLTTTVGKYTTYDSEFLSEEVKGFAMMVEPRLTVTWDLFPEEEMCETEKIKWYDAVTNSLEGAVKTGGWDIDDVTGLVITNDTAAIINIGDVIRVDNEWMVVSAVVRTVDSASISVHARGHGGTTAATHLAGAVIYIVGSAHVEGTVDGAAILEDNVEKVNYCQILEEPISVTKTAKNQKYEDVQDKMDEARQKAMSRALRKINNTCLFGVPSAGSKTTPRSAAGIRYFLSSSADNINVNVAGAFTETVLKSTLLLIATRGGTPDVILCSANVKSVINGFNSTASAGVQTRVDRLEKVAGTLVDFYEGEGVGRLAVFADPLLRHAHGEAYILNTKKMGKMWFKDDTLRYAPEPGNSRTFSETLEGQFTLKIKDAATDFARMYGITG